MRKHSHFQTPLENPSIQTHLVIPCCIKRLCIFGPKGAIQIRYYYYYKSRWRHNWKSAQVVTSHLVCDPTIWQPGFDIAWQQWSLLNRFRTEQGHCDACRRKWQLTDSDLCPCGETQTMFHIVESCPLKKTEWQLILGTLCG